MQLSSSIPRILTLIACMIVFSGNGWAAGQKFEMEPALGVTFPLVDPPENEIVRVRFPVALNETSVVLPDAILRVIYIQPQASDAETKAAIQRGQQSVAYSRLNQDVKNKVLRSPEQEAAQKIVREVVWVSPTNFRLAMENLQGNDMRLVYLDPKTGELIQEPFAFPQGLFMAEKESTVEILAVEKTSNAAKAGLKAGDHIVAVGPDPVNGNLTRTLALYRAAKAKADADGARMLSFTVRSPGGPERVVQFPLPPTLRGSLMDMP